MAIMNSPLVGQSVPRKEDLSLLIGAARFVDDLKLPGMLYGRILRSPFAHAIIKSVDTSASKKMPGVHGVITADDIKGKVEPWGDLMQDLLIGDRFPLARRKVMYEGQEVAAVVAETKYQALDALEAIDVEYEELPAVVDVEYAMSDDAPLVQEGIAREFGRGNVYDIYRVRAGDIRAARQEADLVVRQRFTTSRPVGAALEPHGCIADYDTAKGQLTLYTSTQSVYLVRDALAKAFHLPRNKIRVVAQNVGAGFGSKAEFFPHEAIAALFSMAIGRPVHLVLDRSEVFLVGTSRTPQVRYAELLLKKDGRIIGYKDTIVQDCGAVSAWGNQIIRIGTQIGLLPYKIPNIHVDGSLVHTNTTPVGPLRGFGVPQTVFAKEQLIDMAAEALGIDSVELRLKNVISEEECPYRTSLDQCVDSTSIDKLLGKAAEVIGWEKSRRERKTHEGVGIAVAMKYTSCRHPSLDSDLSAVRVRLETDGTVTVHSSDVPHGQGHETFVAQIISDTMGVSFEKIRVISADTDVSPFGLGTWGSRAGVVVGTAARMAALRVKDKLIKIAAHILEANPSDLEAGNDKIYVCGAPATGLWIENLAILAAYATHQLPDDVEAGAIEAMATYNTPTDRETQTGHGNLTVTYGSCAHAARIRVDPGTGRIAILDYVMAHDCGTIINPLIVEGQHHGAFLHGLGMTLYEDLIYDENGRMLNPTFKDYLAPYASDVPDLSKTYEIPAPSRVVPGGQKGVGESATTPVPATIANALYDAVGIRFTQLPLTPDRILMALREKERTGVKTLRFPDDMPWFKGPIEWPEDKLVEGEEGGWI